MDLPKFLMLWIGLENLEMIMLILAVAKFNSCKIRAKFAQNSHKICALIWEKISKQGKLLHTNQA